LSEERSAFHADHLMAAWLIPEIPCCHPADPADPEDTDETDPAHSCGGRMGLCRNTGLQEKGTERMPGKGNTKNSSHKK
jgi:hypothetical protein